MVFFQNLWWLLVLIGVMILIHELGHYWAARLFDVKVEAFSFGFGPRLFGFRRGETDFRFSAILFGGYVKMAGEQAGDESAADPRAFLAKPRWQRLIIAFAGPFMNLVLAVGILTGLYMVQYPKIPRPVNPVVGYVVAGGAADRAGIRVGDRILQLDSNTHPTWDDVTLKEIASAQRAISVWVERNGQRLHFTVTPVYDPKQGVAIAGWDEQTTLQVKGFMPGMQAAHSGLAPGDRLIALNNQPVYSLPQLHDLLQANGPKPVQITYQRGANRGVVSVTPAQSNADGATRWMIGVELQPQVIMTRLSFPDALAESVNKNIRSAGLVYQFLEGIVTRRMSARSLSGPIGIAQASGQAAREGLTPFLELMVMISLNLAIFNLLPIPILDGGVIVMLLVEMLMRRDLSLHVKEMVLKLGFVFLMAVVAFAIYNDISKIFNAG
jgi:regulator of sigma E protease